MYLQYASNLHLDCKCNEEFLKAKPLTAFGNVLILAGDILPFTKIKEYGWFFDQISEDFEHTFWIPGNHEYHYTDLAHRRGCFFEHIRPNVFLLNDEAITIGKTRLIFATMWTDIRPRNRMAIERRLNDFHFINYNGSRLTAGIISEQHQASIDFIEQELVSDLPVMQKIVVTHHAPTFTNYPQEFKNDVLHDVFAVELKNFIRELQPHYWIYGHHHCNTGDFKIGRTTLTSNQLGYLHHNENPWFDRCKFIEIC